jgi:hypothetical protein
MNPTPPTPFSERDIAALRQDILRGDREAKLAAIKQTSVLGRVAQPLVPLIEKQLHEGLYINSFDALNLLEAIPDLSLYRALVERGVLSHTNPYEKGRLLVLGLGEHEDDLGTYIYQHWRNAADPMVGFAIEALTQAGTSASSEVLAVVLPELSEAVNMAVFDRDEGTFSIYASDPPTPHELLSRLKTGVLHKRLEQIHVAIEAIATRGRQRGE